VQGTVEEEAAAEDQGLLGRFIDYIQVGGWLQSL
jgi:hypothetical protein